MFHALTVSSTERDTIILLTGSTIRSVTAPLCPLSEAISELLCRSHTQMVPS